MLDKAIGQAVTSFAEKTSEISDEKLELEWAWGAYDSDGVRLAFFRNYEDLRELSTAIISQRRDLGVELTTAQSVLGNYHAAYRDVQANLLGVDDELAEQAPAPGEWPLRQVLAHIVQAEIGFYVTVKYPLISFRRSGERTPEIPDNARQQLSGMSAASFDALLEGPMSALQLYYDSLHARILEDFAGISDEELALPTMYWEGYPLPLQFRLHRFDSHCRQHIVQIEKTLVGLGRPPNEARRLLRLVYGALATVESANIGTWEVAHEKIQSTADSIATRTEEITAILDHN